MGKFNEWQDAIEEALKHDIQEKIFYKLMLELGQKPKMPELHFDETVDAIDVDMKKTIESCINQINVSSEA